MRQISVVLSYSLREKKKILCFLKHQMHTEGFNNPTEFHGWILSLYYGVFRREFVPIRHRPPYGDKLECTRVGVIKEKAFLKFIRHDGPIHSLRVHRGTWQFLDAVKEIMLKKAQDSSSSILPPDLGAFLFSSSNCSEENDHEESLTLCSGFSGTYSIRSVGGYVEEFSAVLFLRYGNNGRFGAVNLLCLSDPSFDIDDLRSILKNGGNPGGEYWSGACYREIQPADRKTYDGLEDDYSYQEGHVVFLREYITQAPGLLVISDSLAQDEEPVQGALLLPVTTIPVQVCLLGTHEIHPKYYENRLTHIDRP